MRGQVCLVVSALALCGLAWLPAAEAQQLYSINRDSGELYQLDTADAAILSTVQVVLPGEDVIGAGGLTVHPTTNVLYGLLQLNGQPGRELVTIDPITGLASSIGDTGDQFDGLAFTSAGALYAVMAEEGADPESLHLLNLTDASNTLLDLLDVAGPGEAIGIQRTTNRLFRASDLDLGGHLYQSIDLGTYAATNIAPFGDDYAEATAMAWAGGNNFFLTDIEGNLFNMTTGGITTLIGHIEDPARGGGGPGGGDEIISKGLAYIVPIPEPTSLALLGGLALVGLRRRRR